jgi:hypothetical protein
MRRPAFLVAAFIAGCGGGSQYVNVEVPPRFDVAVLGTVGLIEFTSNADATVNQYATQQFQQRLLAAQPRARVVELGPMQSVLAAVGSSRLDGEAVRKIGRKYEVAGVFHGNIAYGEPVTDVNVRDISSLRGSMHQTIRGDLYSTFVEARSGASLWSSSAWAQRQFGGVAVSQNSISVADKSENPRRDMIPGLMQHVTEDFRASVVRERVKSNR